MSHFSQNQFHHESVVVVIFHASALFIHVHFAEVHSEAVAGFVRRILAAVVLLGDEWKIIFIDTRTVVADPDLDEALGFAVFLRNIVGYGETYCDIGAGVLGGIADNIADTVGRICDIVIMISVLNGVANLAERLHNEKLAELAGKLMNTLIVIIGLSAVATVIPAFFGVNEVFMNISSIMNMVAGGLAIIGTIIYLVFLGKGMKMLKEN